jgi:hypothetical protein
MPAVEIYVFFETDPLKGLNLKRLQVLYPTDTSDHFVEYVKDDKLVSFEEEIVRGADAKSFKAINVEKGEVQDKNWKYDRANRKQPKSL